MQQLFANEKIASFVLLCKYSKRLSILLYNVFVGLDGPLATKDLTVHSSVTNSY